MQKKVLVTAGASGIGRETVRAFAEEGAQIATCDIDEPSMSQLAEEVPGIVTARCDISSRSDIESEIPRLIERLGGLDVLVNNAGIAGPTAPTEALDPDDWERVMRINLDGAFHVTRLAIPRLKESRRATIVNLSSAAGRFGYANRSAYSASKWGVVGFTKTLSIELGEWGICVNAILPGAVEGPRLRRVIEGRAQLSGLPVDQILEQTLTNQSLKALINAKHIAQYIRFLSSEAASSISGQALSMDGDMHRL